MSIINKKFNNILQIVVIIRDDIDFLQYMTDLLEGKDVSNTSEDFDFMDQKMYSSNLFGDTAQGLESGVLADVSMDLSSILSNSQLATDDHYSFDMFQSMF
jgi:hypothetical protein